ncbi:MAG: hypothetical protein GY852_06045 [bacterium]|nr:hypothetical protein [bacterium]
MNTTHRPDKKGKRPEGPPEPKVRPIPKTAKTTMDIRDRRVLDAVMVGAGTNAKLPAAKEPRRTTRSPGPVATNNIPREDEAERLEQDRNNRKFLPYANVHTLISETLNRDKNEWLHDHERTRAAVGKAIGVLSEQSKNNPSDDYTRAKYGLVSGFGKITEEKEALYDFEMWLIKKESTYESLSGAYSEMKMLSFAPYEQVVERCREMIQTSEVARNYYLLVGITAGMNGAAAEDAVEMDDGLTGKIYSTVGELEKLRFDVWLQTRAPLKEEDMLRERNAALLRVGELHKTLDNTKAEHKAREKDLSRAISINAAELGQFEGEKARVSRIYENLEQSDEAVAIAEANAEIANARADEAEARADRTYRMLERADEETDGLDAISEKRFELMTNQAKALGKVADEMAEVREENQKLITRVSEMESNITRLTARLEGRDSGEITEEDAGRETMLSEAIPLPPELASDAPADGGIGAGIDAEIDAALESALGEAPADLTDEAVRESSIRSDLAELQRKAGVEPTDAEAEEAAKADAAALVEAAEAVVEPELPPKEVTAEVPLEEIEEIGEPADERSRLWKTLPGRIIDNIVVYGFRGEGEKRYPPTFENFAGQENQQREFLKASRAYKSWYGVTGRGIRKTVEGTRKHWRAVTAVATGVAVLAAATTGYFTYAPAQEKPEQVALRELQKPTVTQVAVVDETTPEQEKEKEKVKPEPLAKPALADVLAKHGLKLEKGTNMAQFYKGLNVEDVQERYVILEEALRTDEQLQKYERKYSEKPILEMYANFLATAMAYVQLEGQTYAETAYAGATGERVAKRLQKLTQQKRIKKKVGKERAAEMNALADEFIELVGELPTVEEVMPEEEKIVELPVVTPEELEEMKKAGEEPEVPVIILPDTTDEKPFNMEEAVGEAVGTEFKSLDSVSKVNEFNRKINKTKDLETKFLLSAHLSDQLIEHGMGAKMSEKRVLLMHVDAMNAAILFARADGQGMTAIAEALNVFDSANAKVKQYMGYKKIKEAMKKRADLEKNLTWLRNRAKELENKVDAYERNKNKAVPLPGSPAVENENGAPTAMPEKVQINRDNVYIAIQTKVFSDNGLSILEHPLRVQEKMRGMKINSFDKFIIMEKLAEEVLKNPERMSGLTKAEQFKMLGVLAQFLDSARKAANEPKHWPTDYALNNFLLDSIAIDVSDLIHRLRRKRTKDSEPPQGREHLWFPLDEGTFKGIGVAAKTFDEQLNYEYRQKKRMNGNGHGE